MSKDDYDIYYSIGKGGQGTVYLAYSKLQNKLVCIKEIKKDISEEKKAIRLIKQIRHPRLPKIIDEYDDDDRFYYVMEFIKGRKLLEYSKKMNMTKSIEIGLQLLEILDELKNNDLTFNDLKPDNVLISTFGLVYLVDYGAILSVGDVTSKRYGSLYFSSPEYIQKKKVDWQSDLYSIGKILMYICRNPNKRFLKWINKSCEIDRHNRYCSIIEAYSELRKVNNYMTKYILLGILILCLVMSNCYYSFIQTIDINTPAYAVLFHSLDCYRLLSDEYKYDLSNRLMKKQDPIYWVIQESLCSDTDNDELVHRYLFMNSKELEGLMLSRHNLQFYLNYLFFINDDDYLAKAYLCLKQQSQTYIIQKMEIELAFYLKKDDWLIHDLIYVNKEIQAYSLYRLFQLGNYHQGYLHQALELLEDSEYQQLITEIKRAIKQWGDQA